MKKVTVFLLALFSALSLSACGKETTTPDPNLPPQENPAEETQQTETLPTAEPTETPSGNEEAALTLTASIEGQEETRTAELFTGEGYTMVVLDEGWWFESELEDGVQVDTWKRPGLEDLEMSVLYLAGSSVDDAKNIIELDEDDYKFTADEQGNLLGNDPMDMKEMNVRFFAADGGTYVLRMEYPVTVAEGLGMWMNAMADTFQLSK